MDVIGVDFGKEGMSYDGVLRLVFRNRDGTWKQGAGISPLDAANGSKGRGNELPTEVLGDILLRAWLEIPLFDPLHRWGFFSRLSLVNRRFRELAIWMATRHVRVLSQCSMDVAAYRSIGQQCLSLYPDAPHADPEQPLKTVFQSSTVHLDVTYVTYTVWKNRDLWLKDDISPGRPDDEYGVHYDQLGLVNDEYTYPYPERRAPEYRQWLARRRRDRLSGWFAGLLAAVPDCAEVVISAEESIAPLCLPGFAALLEALWWWPSLERVRWGVVLGLAGVERETESKGSGGFPTLPELMGVKSVWLGGRPPCTCLGKFVGMSHKEVTHTEVCTARRMLEPFPQLQTLYTVEGVDAAGNRDVVVPPSAEVVVLADAASEEVEEEDVVEVTDAVFTFGTRKAPPLWVPWLNLSKSDGLWAIVDPQGLRHRSNIPSDSLGLARQSFLDLL
ncbi:hypothetical protein C8Q77DRAFT_306813 [Trametes polyzona]|nr:hypothetical protein C8Q77DRAFT_306813 [Trametes polyzona]